MKNSTLGVIDRIRISNGSVIYDDGTIGLDSVTLDIGKGESLVILGQSGSGKSTLLRTLAGLQELRNGSISWSNADGVSITCPWPNVSIVFQKFFLWPHLRVRENLMLPLSEKDGASASLDESILEALKIEDLLKRYAYQLSVGQQQRVALARAALLEPEYLLVDEVSSALDPERTYDVYNLLRRLNRSGVAIVAVTHLPGLATSYFDDFIFLREGKMIQHKSTDSLISCSDPHILRYLEMASANVKQSGRSE